MKIASHAQRRQGMTLPEVMVASAIFGLAMAALLSLNLFALRLNEIALAKLGASNDARKSIGRMLAEIRMAGLIRIGNGDENSFSEIASQQPQCGNAIQIQPIKADTNAWTRYFLDGADTRLKRVTSGSSNVVILANAVTNQLVFAAEDYNGRILTNNFNNRVIGVTLQFFQLNCPSLPVGPGQRYDFYQLRTKITRRALE